MACYVCRCPEIESVHGNYVSDSGIRYAVHPGTGIQIVKCPQCGFMSVEFAHPGVVAQLYENQDLAPLSVDKSEHANLHRDNCQNQLNSWTKHLPEKSGRTLFWGAGRSEHADSYLALTNEMFTCDLVPENNELARQKSTMTVIDRHALRDPAYEETFDLIILSNVLERMPFPRSQLSLCARLLKSGGILALEVPSMNFDLVRTWEYGPEELNYFSAKSVETLVSLEGNFSLMALYEDNEPAELKNATGYWPGDNNASSSQSRAVLRAIMKNQRCQVNSPQPDILTEDLGLHLHMLSLTCLITGLSHHRYSNELNPKSGTPLPIGFEGH